MMNSLGTLKPARCDAQRARNCSSTAWAPLARLNQRDQLLAPAFAGTTDHQGVRDIGVGPQDLFDLLDEHLLTAGVDHERVAAVQPQRSVRLQRGSVP